MVQICLILSEIAQNCLKWCKITNKCHCGPFWVINDHLWSFWIIIDPFGPFWALLGNFGPLFHNSSGAYKNDPKLKHDLDYQMSTKMVQENHEDNINTQWNQCEILVYFGTIYGSHFPGGILFQKLSVFFKVWQLISPTWCTVETQIFFLWLWITFKHQEMYFS